MLGEAVITTKAQPVTDKDHGIVRHVASPVRWRPSSMFVFSGQ